MAHQHAVTRDSEDKRIKVNIIDAGGKMVRYLSIILRWHATVQTLCMYS